MKLEQLIKLITGKEEFTEQTAVELKKTVEQYPFFSAAISVYLLNLKLIGSLEFENELKKYSIYLGDRRLLLEKIILNSSTELDSDEKEKKVLKAQWYDETVYKNAKKHHDKVMENIIEPKVDKMRKLSELSEGLTVKEKEDKEKPKTETQTELVATQTAAQATKPSEENKKEKKATEYEFIVIGPDEAKKKQKAPVETKSADNEVAREEQKQNPEQTKPIEEKEQPETQQEVGTSAKPQAATAQTGDGIEIDDIFKKIEELKKKKKQSLHEFEHNVNKIDRIVEEQKQREVIATDKKKAEPSKVEDKPQEKNIQKDSVVVTEPAKKEEPAEKQETKDDKVIELAIEPDLDKEQADTPQQSKVSETKVDEAEEVIKSIVEKAKKDKIKKEDLAVEIDLDIANTPVEAAEDKKEPEKQQVPKESHKEPVVKEEKAPEQKTVHEKEEKVSVKEEQSRTTAPSSGHKSAADKILEQLAQRKAQRKQGDDLIDKFLQEQPRIDRKKKPEIEGDLSEPSTKEIEIVTEKMAQIYELQGLYEKAINVYEKLILKKPEKNSYFAQKIEELKVKLAQNEK